MLCDWLISWLASWLAGAEGSGGQLGAGGPLGDHVSKIKTMKIAVGFTATGHEVIL